MLIDCPACARSYPVSRDEIGEGRTVVCPRCDARWFVDGDGTSVTMPVAANDVVIASFNARAANDAIGDRHDVQRASALGRSRPAVAAAAAVLAAMGVLGTRDQIVRMAPRTAAIYAQIGLPVNVKGLEFATVASERPTATPTDVVVSGEVRNVARKRVGVPRLAYQVRDASGAPLMSWTETPPSKTLASGRSLPFVSSPRRLPAEARSILVRFEDDGEPPAPVRLARRTD